jgi:putative tryptophan/tyrosine transport system substrate-binding protein
MRRREFITLLGGAAAVWPLTANAQQPTATTHRLGLLFATSEQAAKARGLLEAVAQGLKEYGWVEGQNLTIEYRFADGKTDALPKLAGEVVQLSGRHRDRQHAGNPGGEKCHANRAHRCDN